MNEENVIGTNVDSAPQPNSMAGTIGQIKTERGCKSVCEIVKEVQEIIKKDQETDQKKDQRDSSEDDKATYWFRGEARNYADSSGSDIGTEFQPCLYRKKNWVKNEREIYEAALRLNIVSFAEDTRMSERVARMQHYGLPTRFCDISDNALLSAFFAADTEGADGNADGFIRVIKVAGHKMKSFTSDIIVAISYLPLVDIDRIKMFTKNGLAALTYEIANGDRPWFYSESENPNAGKRLKKELQQVWAFRPILNNRRIRAQGGAFLAFGCGSGKAQLDATFSPADYDDETKPTYGIKQIGFVRIAAHSKADIRKELRHFGVPEEAVYPDLENVCTSIKGRFGDKKRRLK